VNGAPLDDEVTARIAVVTAAAPACDERQAREAEMREQKRCRPA
jgi:hypothetical protein